MPMSMRGIAITGLGLVCALGKTLADSWPRLMAGVHGFGPISKFDASTYPARIAAEVPGFDGTDEPSDAPGESPLRRSATLFLAAAGEAWRDAGLAAHRDAWKAGVAVGASVNYLHMAQLRALWESRDASSERVDMTRARDAIPRSSFLRRHGDTMAAAASQAFGIQGPRLTIDTACASSAHAIIDACRMIARGECETMIAGGGSWLIMQITVFAFSRLGALSTNDDPASASRPFDRHRDGFVLGEGAAAVVLEAAPDAMARGARIYAHVAGAATSVNASSMTDPSPDGRTEAATMALAMAEARVLPEEVDYVAAHGTSTPRNDSTETQAIKRVLGGRAFAIPVSSHKGQLGHTLPAAGAINTVIAAMALWHQAVAPTAHLETPDPECDLDYVPKVGRRARVRVALAHAFAFGGQNAVLVLRHPEEDVGN
jgi:3-oxoacyl-(acyl-carrier-protein) synthase